MRLASLLALAIFAGCGTDAGESRASLPDTVPAVLQMQWGTLDGDPELAFGQIRSFAVDDLGRLFVHDIGEGIRVFGPEGQFIKTLATRGQGPNEVGGVPVMTYRDGLLAAWDARNARISMWNGELDHLRTLPAPRHWTAYDESAITVVDGREVWVKLAPDWDSDGRGFPRPEYLRVWPTPPDTIFVEAGGKTCDTPYDYEFRNGFWADMRVPWFPSTITALGPNGEVFVGCNDSFSFTRHAGADTMRFSRQDRNQVVPDAEREFFETAWAPPMGPLPRTRPEFSRIIPSGDGRVWVYETIPAQEAEVSDAVRNQSGFGAVLGVGETGGRFSVFGEDGDLLAIVPLPEDVHYSGFPTTPSVLVRGDTLLAVRRGEFDEEYIARYVVNLPRR